MTPASATTTGGFISVNRASLPECLFISSRQEPGFARTAAFTIFPAAYR